MKTARVDQILGKYSAPALAEVAVEPERVPAQTNTEPARVPEPNPQAGLTCWQDSEPVAALSAILSEWGRQHGCRIVWDLRVGAPTIQFRPGLSLSDHPERWEFACVVVGMAEDAAPDLRELRRLGLLSLPAARDRGPMRPVVGGRSPDPIAGPPGALVS